MALVLGGCRLWTGITCGAFLTSLWAGAPVPVACGIALGNTLEARVGALLLQRLVGFSPALDRLRDVLGLVVLVAVLSTLVSATVGVTSGWRGGMIPVVTFGKAWLTWWLGDAMGDLVVAPLPFVWSGRERLSQPRLWVVEAVAVGVATGEVHVEWHADTAWQAALVVRDNGIGFPDAIDFRHTESLGLQLVVMLTEQFQGTIALERADGTTFTLTFPVRHGEA